jgi:hypothetical protein
MLAPLESMPQARLPAGGGMGIQSRALCGVALDNAQKGEAGPPRGLSTPPGNPAMPHLPNW